MKLVETTVVSVARAVKQLSIPTSSLDNGVQASRAGKLSVAGKGQRHAQLCLKREIAGYSPHFACGRRDMPVAIISLDEVIVLAILSHMKTIVLTHRAAKELDDLSAEGRLAVTSALDEYAITGAGDVKALSGRAGCRLRVGRYRVIFADDGVTILAIYIGKRETTTYRRN